MKTSVTATLATVINDEIVEIGTLSLVAPDTPVPCEDIADEGWVTVAFQVYAEDTVETETLVGTFVSAIESGGKVEASFEVGTLGTEPLYLVVDPAWVAYPISVVSDDFDKYKTLNTED